MPLPWDLKGDGSFDPNFYFSQKQVASKPPAREDSAQTSSPPEPQVIENNMELEILEDEGLQ